MTYKSAFSISNDSQNDIDFTFRLINYFNEFSKSNNLSIPISTLKEGHEIYFFPESETNETYDEELFETFFQLKLSSKKYPEKLFIKLELKYLEKHFDSKLRDAYPIIELWEYYLISKRDSSISSKKNYKEHIWFKVGLKFAKGEIKDIRKSNKETAPEIAKRFFGDEIDFKVERYRPYISESRSNTSKSDKNIFSNNEKLLKIYTHCKENGIKVDAEFKSRIQFN